MVFTFKGNLETVQTKQEAVHKVDQLRKQFKHWDWNISEDEDKWEAKADFTPEKDVNESITYYTTVTERQVQTYIVYEVQVKVERGDKRIYRRLHPETEYMTFFAENPQFSLVSMGISVIR